MKRTLGLTAIAVLVAACASMPSGPQATDGPVAIHTNPMSGVPCLLVNRGGVLVADPTWGLALAGTDEQGNRRTYGVLWPRGWTARREAGVIVLVGLYGAVLAREGDTVVLDAAGGDPLTPCTTIQVVKDHSPSPATGARSGPLTT